MWIKGRRSRFLLIRIKAAGKHGIVLPISLVVFDQLLNAWFEVAEFITDLLPARFNRSCREKCRFGLGRAGWSINGIIGFLRELWDEVRFYGRWQVVRVENDEVRVELDFY
jgi:hypothetical protein